MRDDPPTMSRTLFSLLTLSLSLLVAAQARAAPGDYFAIRVVDADTGRGVPLVELSTTYKQRYVTDSAGYVAFLEPGLMGGDDVWFDVRSYGYESPKGMADSSGVALMPTPGASAEIRLKRTQIAERLYRQTGYGIYRDSVLLGRSAPIKQPLLNARVTGQDTVQTARYRGEYFWFWQDTDQLGFTLGSFAMTGATAAQPTDPDAGIDFTYFIGKPGGFARAMADLPRDGSTAPLWLDGFTVVKDKAGEEKMLARYVAVDAKMMPLETGLAIYDDARQVMTRLKKFEGNAAHTPAPNGRLYRVVDGGKRYVCYTGGLRVLADFEHASDPAQYEAFTCLKDDGSVDRVDGRPHWRWQRGAKPLTRQQLDALAKSGALKSDELPIAMRDRATKKPIRLANGSIAWSPYLKCWTYVFAESKGDSEVGEIWLATARSPEGPWRDAVKIATHARPRRGMDFYNVIQHEDLARDGGRYVYFEGTFVNTFSGTSVPTPYYDYNNVMYRLDLADPRVALPEPLPGWTDVSPDAP